MIKMRNNWDEVRISSLHGNDKMSLSQHSVSDENKSRYDFGIADRSISAPPPSGMGFDVLKDLDDSTWGNNDEVSDLNNEFQSVQIDNGIGSKDVRNTSSYQVNDAVRGQFNLYQNGESIVRSTSAAPQLSENSSLDRVAHINPFQSQTDGKTSTQNSLFPGFDIMKIGARRSASTGIIGSDHKSSSAVRGLDDLTSNKKPTSFMDFIQEDDIPKETSRGYKNIESSVTDVNIQIDNEINAATNYSPPRTVHPSQINHHSIEDNGHFNQNIQMDHLQQIHNSPNSGMKSMGINQAQDHQNGITLPHNQHDTYLHAQQNAFEQQLGVQYYNTHQRDGSIPMHVQPNAMHPQVIQSNGTVNPPIFVSPAYGGYTTVQYHQPPYGQVINPVVHPHGADVKGRMSHPPQYVTAVPMQGGIPGQISAVPSNGTFIYFHQQGHAPAQTHPQTIAIVDANGHPTTIAVPQNNRRNVNREQQIKTSPVLGSRGSDKSNRKSNRGSNKRVSTNSSLDSSRHSLSSGTLTLLEEYRSSKYKAWTAEDVKGHIVEFCQDQNGSRFVQQRLEVAKGSEMALITSEILSSVHILRNDVFGNYVVQKMFDHGSHDIIVALKESLKGQVVSLSSEMYGCRVVQKAMEKVDDEDLIDLLSEFHDTVLNCIHDQNGNHVIQKIIPVISSRSKTYQAEDKEKAINFSKQLNFVLDCVIENIVPLSCHPFGCRVLQRILEHCIESQKSRALDAIQRCLRILLDDQYGNYVIQHVLQFGRKSDRDVVLQIVIENGILGLSRQKFASNVIEKLLKYGNGSHRNQVVREMLKVVEDRTVENGRCSIALLMVRDAYANYVVQTTLNVVPEGEEKELLLQDLRNNSAQLRNYTFAKHIITKLEEVDAAARRSA